MPSIRMKRQDALVELEVEEGATEVELRAAYKRQAMIWHPDRNSAPEAKETFQRKHAAYDRLVLHADVESEDDEDDYYSDEEYEAAFAEMFWEFMMHQTRKRASSFPGFGFSTFSFGPMPNSSSANSSSGRPRAASSGYQPAGYSSSSRSRSSYYGADDEDEDDVPDFGPSEEAAWRDHQRAQDRQRRAAEAKQRKKEDEAYQRQINAEYERRVRAQQEARAKAGQQLAEEAASAARAAVRQAAVRKLPRPTTLQRGETEMQLHLRRDKRDTTEATLPEGCRYQLQMRKTGLGAEAAWEVAHDKPREPLVTVSDLAPGTRYAFRSRSGCQVDESDDMMWGSWSTESQYVTLGNAPAASQPKEAKPAAVPEGMGKKARKRENKLKSTRAKSGGSGSAFAEPEIDLAAERERVKEQKAREAAVKAMQEKAAQEYREEAAKIAAEASTARAAAQAQAAARAKARVKPRSSIPPSSTTFSAQNTSAASGEASASGKFNFGGVRGVAPQILTSTGGSHYDYRDHLPSHQRPARPGKDKGNNAPPPTYQPPQEAYGDDEDEQLREAIELSLALEESRKLYADDYSYEEDDSAFPALGNGKPSGQQQASSQQQQPASYPSSSSGDWNAAAQPFEPSGGSFYAAPHNSPGRAAHAFAPQPQGLGEAAHGYYGDVSPSDESSQSHAEYSHSVPPAANAAPAGDWDAAYEEHNSSLPPGPPQPPPFYPPPPRQSYQPPPSYPPRRYNPGTTPTRGPPVPTGPPTNSFGPPRSNGYAPELPTGEQTGSYRGPPGYDQTRGGPSQGPPVPPGLAGRAPYRPPGQGAAIGRAGSGQGSGSGSTGSSGGPKSPFTHLFPQEAS